MKIHENKDSATKKSDWERDGLVVAFSFALLMFIFYLLTENKSELGTTGDWFGGTLNPLIAFLALLGLTRSVKVQRQALIDARKVATKQLDRQTFFDLLNLRGNAVAGVRWENENTKTVFEGRSAIKAIAKSIEEQTSSASYYKLPVIENKLGLPANAQPPLKDYLYFFAGCYANLIQPRIFDGTAHVSSKLIGMESEIGHVFRSTYQILKFIYNCEEFSFEEKQDLVNFLRAQMSEAEFLLYALSGCSNIGKRSRAISIHYDLFENRLNNISWATGLYDLFRPEINDNKIFSEKYFESRTKK